MAVFVGPDARLSARTAAEEGMNEQSTHAFRTLSEVAAFLKSKLRAGDLVLIHGWQGRHIERVVLAQLGTISCSKERCGKLIRYDLCPELGLIRGAESLGETAVRSIRTDMMRPTAFDLQLIAGRGVKLF
jgi:hypothetical protein